VNLAVWVKDRAGQGSFLRSQHELILIHKAKGGRFRNNVQLGRFGRNRSNVWSYPSAVTAGKGSDEGNILDQHPTPKPVRLVADALLDTTRRGDAVLDPFLGSGTTLIAAEKVGRVCFGLELDPLYVDLIIRRFQAWSGINVTHAITGELFDERAAGVMSAE
jgi:DNA modification methylase